MGRKKMESQTRAKLKRLLAKMLERIDQLQAELASEYMRHVAKAATIQNELKTARQIVAELMKGKTK